MKLKTVTIDGKVYAEVVDDKPVFIGENDKEIAFDVPNAIATITARNGEAMGHRRKAEELEARLKAFDGITDPAAALKALNTVKNLDDKRLVDAGEVEKVKTEAIKAIEEKYAPIVKERDALSTALHQEKIGGAFARSKFIAEKIAIPADMVEKAFGQQFTIVDGKVIAKDLNGNQLYSKSRPGEPADFEEALELLVDSYPHKASILKGSNASGSGALPSAGPTGSKTISRAEFSKLDPATQMARIKDGASLVD